MMKSIWTVPTITVLLATHPSGAWAEAPFIANVFGTYDPGESGVSVGGDTFADIAYTEREFTVPAGTAYLTWTLPCNATSAYVRPAIGAHSPAGAAYWNTDFVSGSWVTPIEAGTHSVRLQVACEAGAPGPCFGGKSNGFSMSLVVFPPTVAGAPAVGGVGLLVMVAALVAAGGVMVSRRRVAGAGAD